jgi:hypothetical protein
MLKKCGSQAVTVVRAFIDRRTETILTLSLCTDVGGGSVVNGTRNSLARIPLRWMVQQCFIANTGIMFHICLFRRVDSQQCPDSVTSLLAD